jgi:hypothetical protein
MRNIRIWLIKKLVKNTPIIMNVTIRTKGILSINGSESRGIFENFYIDNVEEEN